MIDKNAVWLITGSSRGLGRAIAEKVLQAGYRAVLTARNPDQLRDLAEKRSDAVLVTPLDVTQQDQIDRAYAAAIDRFGRVDVLVNNAGYGYLAAIEEGEDAEMRALYAPVNLIKKVLPGMRQRRQGHIVNVSSIGGLVTYPGVGYYHMVKFGLEAMSDTLAKEVAGLGIGVTVVAPGAFRTDFRGPESMKFSSIVIDDYKDTAGKSREGTAAGHRKQIGDPARGAEAIIEAVEAEHPPVHLLIGGDALDQLRKKLEDVRAETDAWEGVTRSTDFKD
jgi:NAD(P)-dependent dehydrogenase (short-subunit alcohol dehydrogenase family)